MFFTKIRVLTGICCTFGFRGDSFGIENTVFRDFPCFSCFPDKPVFTRSDWPASCFPENKHGFINNLLIITVLSEKAVILRVLNTENTEIHEKTENKHG